MLDFVAKAFRGLVSFVLVLIIITFAIIGAVIGGITEGGRMAFLLFLVGGLIGFIIAILFGGFIANFLNMVDNIGKQNQLLKLLLTHYGVSTISIDVNDDINTIKPDEKIESGSEFIVTNKKRLWKEPSFSAEILVYLKKETKIKFISEYDDSGTKWLFVETIDGEKGYTIKGDLRLI